MKLPIPLSFTELFMKMREYFPIDKKTNRSMKQSPEINPHIDDQLICDKITKGSQWKKSSLFYKLCWNHRLSNDKK